MTATVMFNGSLYTGEVVRVTEKRMLVTFTTGTGTTRTGWFAKTTKPAGTLVGRRTGGRSRWGHARSVPVLPADAVTIPANSAFLNEEPCKACGVESRIPGRPVCPECWAASGGTAGIFAK